MKYYLLFFILFLTLGVNGQKIDINPPKATFWIKNFPTRADDATRFGRGHYHNLILFSGDGNFIRINDTIEPNSIWVYDYAYIDKESKYLPLALLIDRKSGDEPPEGEMAAYPFDPKLVDILGNFDVNDDNVHIVPSSSPPLPANLSFLPIPANSVDKIGMTSSHFTEPYGFYAKKNRVISIPIGYKPPDTQGLLLFFYNGDINTGFNYHKKFKLPNRNDSTGTLIPNYYGKAGFRNTSNRMAAMVPIDSRIVSSNYTGSLNKVIIHEITQDELRAFKNGGNKDELRLFHFLKAGNGINAVTEQPFIAALYSTKNQGETPDKFEAINRIFPSKENPLRDSIRLQNKNYHFVDAQLLSIKSGEPDDPNGLRVIDIKQCDPNKYLLTFELVFSNQGDREANGANVVLNILNNPKSNTPFLECLQLVESTSPETEIIHNCCTDQNSSGRLEYCNFNHGLNDIDQKYCIRYARPGLGTSPTDSARLVFTATIYANQLSKIHETPVLDYCVELHGGIEEDIRVCGQNEVLNIVSYHSKVEYSRDNSPFLKPVRIDNPIWTDRDIRAGGMKQNCTCNQDAPTNFWQRIKKWFSELFQDCCTRWSA